MTVYGDGKQTRSFQYVSDLVDGLMALIEGEHIGPFNLGNPGEFTMLDLVQEIVGSLDSALVGSGLTPIQKSDSQQGIPLKQSLTLMECLRSCWREDVLFISISDRFLRLTLQIISRYMNWMSTGLSARRTCSSGSTSPFEWALSASTDDFVYIIHDLDHLAAEVCGNYIGHVFQILSSRSTEVVLDHVKHSILQGTAYLTDDTIDKLIQGAAFKITGHYHELAADIVNTARKTETLLQRLRLGAQRRAEASSDVSKHNVSETDRICMQLFIDIQEYGHNLAALRVEATKISAYRSLWQLVAPQDKPALTYDTSIFRYTPISDPDSNGYFDLMIKVWHVNYTSLDSCLNKFGNALFVIFLETFHITFLKGY